MNGLEVSRRFFHEWGLPFLGREFPRLVDRVAAGRVGGSDVIGADDEWSQDHDWGPTFGLFLTEEDYQVVGAELSAAINAAAPRTFLGCRYHFFGREKDPIDVGSIDGSARYHAGRTHPPQTAREWFLRRGQAASLVERESWLYFFVHGPVFHDPLGEFTARKQMFARYPPDVRRRLIADLCLGIWADGEYKFCTRYVHRKDQVTIHVALGSFVQQVMRLCFLVNDDYAPHEVWLHHEFRKLPEAEELDPKLQQLVASRDLEEQCELVHHVSHLLRRRLLAAGLVDSEERDYGLRCRDVEARIGNKWVREMHS